jgi:hypothetical protein
MGTVYCSNISHDEFMVDKIKYQKETDNRYDLVIKLINIDKLIDNISLMNSIIDECLKRNEYYILYEYNKKCKYPPFKIEKYTINNIIYNRFTLNQFKRFYIDNIHHIINTNNIYIEIEHIDEDGWTYVCNKTKIKKEKMNKLLDEIEQIKYHHN